MSDILKNNVPVIDMCIDRDTEDHTATRWRAKKQKMYMVLGMEPIQGQFGWQLLKLYI